MDKVRPGEYVTILKSGDFWSGDKSRRHKVSEGDRARVLLVMGTAKKRWALVDLVGKSGNVYGRIRIPSWWLRPRSVLDDLAEA